MIEKIERDKLVDRIVEIMREFRAELDPEDSIGQLKILAEKIGVCIDTNYSDVIVIMYTNLCNLILASAGCEETISLDTDALYKLTASQLMLELKITLNLDEDTRVIEYRNAYRALSMLIADMCDGLVEDIYQGEISTVSVMYLKSFENFVIDIFEKGFPNKKYRANFTEYVFDKLTKK